jgi:glycosyltransferase involved in cell wall biosynthesis
MSENSSAIENRPLVSVVTPVYNGEKFLRNCIESVLAQTYPHWDYTIVNNCSTDRSLEIATEYAARDPRIRVHDNKEFVRVIENYNNAFRQISPRSKYCKVVAADDLLCPECLEKMVDLAEKHPTIAIVGSYGLEGNKVMWQGLPFPSTLVQGRQVCRSYLLQESYVFGTPTSLLFRSEDVLRRHAFFNESNLHADSESCLELLENRDFGFIHQVLTIQGVQEDSMSSFSDRFQTALPWILYKLKRYGLKFLGEDELARVTRKHLHRYYWYLGGQVYLRRGRKFWDFHRQKLAELGYPLSNLRLAKYAATQALDVLLNPKKNLGILVRGFRKRPSTPPAERAAR